MSAEGVILLRFSHALDAEAGPVFEMVQEGRFLFKYYGSIFPELFARSQESRAIVLPVFFILVLEAKEGLVFELIQEGRCFSKKTMQHHQRKQQNLPLCPARF